MFHCLSCSLTTNVSKEKFKIVFYYISEIKNTVAPFFSNSPIILIYGSQVRSSRIYRLFLFTVSFKFRIHDIILTVSLKFIIDQIYFNRFMKFRIHQIYFNCFMKFRFHQFNFTVSWNFEFIKFHFTVSWNLEFIKFF